MVGRSLPLAYEKVLGQGESSLEEIENSKKFQIYPQADSDQSQVSGSAVDDVTVTANTTFHDASPGDADWRGEVNPMLHQYLHEDKADIKNFFARPLRVFHDEWVIGQELNINDINPWRLFFENPRVINRISNHKLMKCTLNVKVVINGGPQYYGRAMLSYRPLHVYDAITLMRVGNKLDLVEASQRPHVFINPTSSEGGTLKLPFFTPLAMLDITKQDWRTMGTLDLSSFAILRHAQGGNVNADISIFVWTEDIVLAGLTNENPNAIVPQAMSEEKIIISKPASVLASVASMMVDVPYIGKLARATEIGASSLAKAAALFGYSKPTNNITTTVQPVATQSMALCDGLQSIAKLSVDSKQELSIDPTIAGLQPTDELAILNVATRESYLTRFEWSSAMPSERLLFTTVVDPGIVVTNGTSFTSEIHMPALAFVSQVAEYWKGTLRYRFQIACSQLHKGRLRIVYDPYGGSFAAPDYNTCYQEVVDISKHNDFTIDVGWGQSTPYRRRLNPDQAPDTLIRVAEGVVPANPIGLYNSSQADFAGNGVLSVYTQQDLTSPNNANQEVIVLVSVSACEDFELAVPTNMPERLTYFPRDRVRRQIDGAFNGSAEIGTSPGNLLAPISAPLSLESIEEVQEDIEPQGAVDELTSETSPVAHKDPLVCLGPRSIISGDLNKIYFGEKICSLRQLLKRWNYHESIFNKIPRIYREAGGRHVVFNLRRSVFPHYCEFSAEAPTAGVNLVQALDAGNFQRFIPARMTLINYLAPAYGGWRGTIRRALDCGTLGASDSATHVIVSNRITQQAGTNNWDSWDPPGGFQIAENLNALTAGRNCNYITRTLSSMQTGSSIQVSNVNPFQAYEIPFYTFMKFFPTKAMNPNQVSAITSSVAIDGITRPGDTWTGMQSYVAAGEDFTLLFYLGPPILYKGDIRTATDPLLSQYWIG